MKSCFLFLLLLSNWVVPAAQAHEMRPAYLKITKTDDVGTYDLVWKQPVLANKKLKISPVFPESCQQRQAGPGEISGAALIERWRLVCDPEGLIGKTIVIAGLERTMIDVFVETISVDGVSHTRVLKPKQAFFVMGGKSAGGGTGVASYFGLGLRHLLQGFDHILFIIGLVLLIRTPMSLVKVVTSFTLAHSLTLGLSTYGIVQVSQGVVEAVIALSILFLAVELAKKDDISQSLVRRYPWAIAFIFGLLHGFGFAGALAEIGLPQGAAALALFLFNLGVEAGQLIIVGLVLLAIVVSRALRVPFPHVTKLAPSYMIGTLASYWFIERTLQLF